MLDRHPTDFAELLFGLAFVATGAGFIVHQTTNGSFDAAWIAAIALVATGCAFLIVTLFQRPQRDFRPQHDFAATPAPTGIPVASTAAQAPSAFTADTVANPTDANPTDDNATDANPTDANPTDETPTTENPPWS